jgi:hypothetical protein
MAGGQGWLPGNFENVRRKGGRFSSWELVASPEWASEGDLELAVRIGCVFPTDKHYLTFLSWANESADRALADERFTVDPEEERLNRHPRGRAFRGWRIEGVYPGNPWHDLGECVFCACLA